MKQKFTSIIETVSSLYQHYGIKSVTMDDVAREIGMSKKTLYTYVSNKDDLVSYYVEHITNRRKDYFKDIIEQDLNAIEELVAVNQRVIKMLRDYNPATEYDLKKYYRNQYEKYRKKRRQNIYDSVKANVMKGKEEGLYRSDIDADIIARIHVSRIENSFANEMFSLEELTSWRFVREMMIYHVYGISTKKGIQEFNNILGGMDLKNK